MNKYRALFLLPLSAFLGFTSTADEISIPRMLNYQGKLTNNNNIPVRDSTYSITFRLFSVPTGGSAFWTETQNISTRAGLFNCLLGGTVPIPYIPTDGHCYLEMQVNPNPPMSPRVRIVSSAYAYCARKADSANYLVGGGDYIQNQNTNPQTPGRFWISGQGRATAASSGVHAILGEGGTLARGIQGTADGSTLVGVAGWNLNSSGTGIIGAGNGLSSVFYPAAGCGGAFNGNLTGIYARIPIQTTGARGGYFVLTDDGVTGYYASVAAAVGGYFYKVIGDGAVSTIKATREGKKILFAPEMPEAYFEDVGQGQLTNGHCRINLDPLFLDCITVTDQHPLVVFVQLKDDCNGVYVKEDRTGFDVYELKNGTSNARFSYRVLGKWKGYEKLRFPDADQSLKIREVKESPK